MEWTLFGLVLLGFLSLGYQIDRLQRHIRILRLQMNRLSYGAPSDADVKRAEADDVDGFTEADEAAINAARGMRWALENPEGMKRIEREMAERQGKTG